MSDARYEEGVERPLRLQALDAEDLKIISALVQDAVFPASEMAWNSKRREFGLLVNRFRWENQAQGRTTGDAERVQAVLMLRDVLSVASSGIDRNDQDLVLSLLSIQFSPAEDGAGYVSLILAGDGEIRLAVECLDVALSDVTRPYRAPSRKAPSHPLDKDD